MSQSAGSTSFTLFGIRVDCIAPVLATPMIWESAISRGGMRVVLADMWTLLMAQRDFALWEALSAAEFVLPLGDDPIIRRTAARQHLPVTRADGLLFDLFDTAASSRRRVVIVAPSAELNTDLVLMRQVWPELQVTGLLSGEIDDLVSDRELARTINEVGPELLVLGGDSPWQEYWSHAYRDELEIGAAVLLPTLHPVVAAMAQRAGRPVAGVGPLRRKAAIRRALNTTLGSMASASAETVRAWLQEAREGLADWSATLQARHRPSPLNQLALPAPGQHSVGSRVRAGRPANESSGHWPGISPLARLGPPRQGIGLPAAASGDTPASATQHAPDGPAGDPSHAPEYEADQAPEHIFAVSSPSADSAASSAVHDWPAHQVEPEELLAIANASPASSVFDDRQYWAEQPTTALTVDQLSAASRAAPQPDATSMGDDTARPPAPHYPEAEDPAQGEHEGQSPPDQDPYDDDRLLVFEAHSPVDWTGFLAAEEGYDELPPTTKLDPRVVVESGRGIPSGAQISLDPAPTQRLRPPEPGELDGPDAPSVSSASSAQPSPSAQARQALDVNGEAVPAAPAATEDHALDPGGQGQEQEVVEFARPGGSAAAHPAPRQDGAHHEGSVDETKGNAQPESVKVRLITRYVVERSRRRFMRERRYHRSLKKRHQSGQG